jgi:hypothetical protein
VVMDGITRLSVVIRVTAEEFRNVKNLVVNKSMVQAPKKAMSSATASGNGRAFIGAPVANWPFPLCFVLY